MKKFIACAAVLLLSVTAGCGKKASTASEITENTTASETTAVPETQPDPLAVTTTKKAVTTAAATTVQTTTTDSNGKIQADPHGSSSFELTADGALSFSRDFKELSSNELMQAAQELFTSACHTEWSFTVDCPYTLDTENCIENDFHWQFCKVTNDGINSMDDVYSDYHKVFSSERKSQLADLYMEKDGAVYALKASRGGDLYYSHSTVSEVKSISDDEIAFTVTDYYSGSDRNPGEPCSVNRDFSMKLSSDNLWKASAFTLPY